MINYQIASPTLQLPQLLITMCQREESESDDVTQITENKLQPHLPTVISMLPTKTCSLYVNK